MTASDIMSRPLIFAVDNAPMFLDTLKKLLKDEPYNLHVEKTGAETMEFLQSARPDLILLDIEMPDMDGYELARKIKSSGQKAPILFVTAHNDKETTDKAMEAGAAGVLHKPIRREGLVEAIKTHIK